MGREGIPCRTSPRVPPRATMERPRDFAAPSCAWPSASPWPASCSQLRERCSPPARPSTALPSVALPNRASAPLLDFTLSPLEMWPPSQRRTGGQPPALRVLTRSRSPIRRRPRVRLHGRTRHPRASCHRLSQWPGSSPASGRTRAATSSRQTRLEGVIPGLHRRRRQGHRQRLFGDHRSPPGRLPVRIPHARHPYDEDLRAGDRRSPPRRHRCVPRPEVVAGLATLLGEEPLLEGPHRGLFRRLGMVPAADV